MAKWNYEPSQWVPFRDKKALDRCRRIKRSEIEKHRNPKYKIRVMPDADMEHLWIADMFKRVLASDREDRKTVLILPNPAPTYRKVARLINECRANCRNLWGFAMDEYADQNGNIAPPDWKWGFTWSMMNYFWKEIDEDLRPPKKQFIGFTNKNIKDYSAMLEDAGNADACYSGPGWTGHLAFIEPDAPEFDAPLKEWKKMGARICTLSPYTLAQNSLHGSFGMSGDIARVPPKAATIGPLDVIRAKYRFDMHSLLIHGSQTTWQRLMTRLCLHGPVTPKLPTSLLQETGADVYVSESSARDIVDDFEKGY